MVSTKYLHSRPSSSSKFHSGGAPRIFSASRALSSGPALLRQAQERITSSLNTPAGSKGAAAIEAVGCICVSLVACAPRDSVCYVNR